MPPSSSQLTFKSGLLFGGVKAPYQRQQRHDKGDGHEQRERIVLGLDEAGAAITGRQDANQADDCRNHPIAVFI